MLCSRRHHGAVLGSWSRGYRAAGFELELPKAALSPPGRFTAEPPPEGWSSLYPYPLLREPVYTADLGRRLRRLTSRHVMLGAPVRALGALWPRLFSFAVFADGCRRPSRRSSVRGRSLCRAVLCRRGTLYPQRLALPKAARTLYTAWIVCDASML